MTPWSPKTYIRATMPHDRCMSRSSASTAVSRLARVIVSHCWVHWNSVHSALALSDSLPTAVIAVVVARIDAREPTVWLRRRFLGAVMGVIGAIGASGASGASGE